MLEDLLPSFIIIKLLLVTLLEGLHRIPSLGQQGHLSKALSHMDYNLFLRALQETYNNHCLVVHYYYYVQFNRATISCSWRNSFLHK